MVILGRSDYTTNAGEIDMSTEGVKTLVITYGEMTATIKLTVTGEKSGVIASGEYKENGNNITWVIDADGKLTVEGTGDFVAPRYMNYDRAPWYNDRASIESAEINVTGMTNASCMFRDCIDLASIDMSSFDTSNVTDMESMFSGCGSLTSIDVSSFVTRSVTNMDRMFCGCGSLTSIDLSSFDTRKVTDMGYMFAGCSSLASIDMNSFATGNDANIEMMFYNCSSLTSIDLSSFNTSSVTKMNGMFYGCSSLTSIDLNGFDTRSITDMRWLFEDCSSLTSIDVSSFDTSSVTSMQSMFYNCSSLVNIDVSNFDTSSVTDMNAIFLGCSSLTSIDVGNFDTSSVTNMSLMFYGCSSLESIDMSSFSASSATNMDAMFSRCSKLLTLRTPYNLKLSVALPSGTWYQTDGTQITELPQNLDHSILIKKDEIPIVSAIKVAKTKTNYVCGETINVDDLTVTYYDADSVARELEVSDYTTNADKIDMSTPGIKTLEITYEGITVELELIVTYLLDEDTVEIILPDETYIYDGTAKKPEPIVTASKTNTKLTSGKDYTISYESNIDAGTAFMIITGQNDYQGTLKSSFRINKAAAPETVEVNIYTPCNKVQEGQSLDIAGRYGEYGRITGYEIKDIVEDNEIDGTVFAGTPYIQDGILYYGTNTGKDGDSAAVTVEVSFANYESALLNVVVEFTDERAVYTVRFELAGHGQPIAPITVLETGSLIEEPIQPEAEGFRFMGWYKDQSCTKVWDFDTDTVQDNIILYAGWLVEASDSEGADLYIQEIQNQIYTGSALKPSIRVYAADGDTRLKEGKDYTIKYFNNKNADQSSVTLAGGTSQTGEEGDNGFTKKLAYVIIKGKGNYKGTIYRNFHIDAASIAGNDGEMAKGFTLKYKEQLLHNASKAQKPFQSIRYKKNMKAGTDYEWKLSALEAYDSEGNKLERGNVIIDADSFVPLIPAGYKGTFLLTITGIGNYKGSIDKTVCVTDKKHLLKNATVSMGKNCKSVRYTGEDITLRPAYYDASQKKYYTVDDDGVVSTQAEPDGNNVFVVKAGGKCLKYGEDYTVSYTNNQAVGTATMTISGKGEYLGSKDVTFRITGMAFNAKNISVDGFEASMEYTGKPLTQNGVRLKSIASSTENSIELTYGKDYTVNYKNNLKKGTATMTFTANPSSGYTGRFKKTFKITAASLTDTVKVTTAFPLEDRIADGEVISLEGIVAYEKAGAKPSGRIRLYNKDGILLKEGIDYSVSYAHNKVVTTADTTNLPVMNLKGKGNYTGSLSVNFRITAASMEDNENLAVTAAEVAFYKNKADNYTYQPKITVMDGKHTLNSRTDYTVRYERCTQAEIKNYLDALQGGRATEEELEQLKPYVLIEAKKGNGYVGSIRKELTVYRTKLTGNNLYIVINTDTSQITYTGEQVKPEVTVYYGDLKAVKKARNKKETREKILTDKTGDYCLTKLSLKISENGIGDYTLSYGRNVTAGKNKGNVTVIGTGLYGGRVKVKFTINSKDVYTASK